VLKTTLYALIAAPLTLNAAYAATNNAQLLNESVAFEEGSGGTVPIISAQLITKKTPYQKTQGYTPKAAPINIAAPAPSTSEMMTHSHFIYPDETYVDAINRWVKRDDITHLAWAIDETASDALSQSPVGTVSFEGSTLTVISKLSRQLGVPFYMKQDTYYHRAAIHQWHNREVQIAMVGGGTLKETVRQLTLDYDWQWVDTPSSQSWLAANDYAVSINYPIVTPKGDLKRALQLVLNGYPVSAKLLEGSHTLFIVDTQ